MCVFLQQIPILLVHGTKELEDTRQRRHLSVLSHVLTRCVHLEIEPATAKKVLIQNARAQGFGTAASRMALSSVFTL